MELNTLIVIAGPTASGKTAAAIEIAKHYNTVVVSADSRQFYREMSIGTAKPNTIELSATKHYFIDNLSITEIFTAGDYEKECLKLLDGLFQQHNKVILVGGSGLFIKAVCEGFDEFPDAIPGVRESLIKALENDGMGHLQEKLMGVDPEYYSQVDLNNSQRVIRALEVFESTGKPYSSFRRSALNARPFQTIKFGLNLQRELLYRRINQRVDDMVRRGLIAEARGLLPCRHLNALHTVGYTELFDYFDGKTDLDTAIALIKQNTRRFAKRQLTWFNKEKDINWQVADNGRLIEDMITLIDNLSGKN